MLNWTRCCAVLDPDAKLSVDAIDLVAALVDRSLLRSTDDANGSRFAMLETIREYAAERLAASDEATYTRDCHAAFYADVAARSRGVLQAPDRDVQLDRLDSDMPNLRAALEWAIEDGNFERAAVIAVGLKDFWRTRSHLPNGAAARPRSRSNGASGRRARAPTFFRSRLNWQLGRATTNNARWLSGRPMATLEAIGDRPGLAHRLELCWLG